MRLGNIDSRWIYLAIFLSVLLPLFKPLGLPITVSQTTRDTYDFIQALPPGADVIVSPSFSPSSDAEVLPQMMAVLKHLMTKKVHLTWVNLNVEGIMYAEKSMAQLKDAYGYKYGTNYVILPFLPGMETAVASMASGFRQVFQTDVYGTPLSEIPLMQNIRSISDYDLVIDFNTGDTGIYYLQQVQPKGVPVIVGASGVTVPYLMPYLDTRQLAGLLGGLRGAAEYEILTGTRGVAVQGMDAQSLSHGVTLLFIIAGNIAYLVGRKGRA